MTAIGPRELSPRQREILALVAAGRTSKEIAGQLGISESTVNWHLANAFERLGASSRAEAVALSMRDEVTDSNGHGAETRSAVPSRTRRAARPTLPLSSIALAFALTLLVGLVGGALIAEWNMTSPTPSPSAPPTGPASPSAMPTAQPTSGGVPRSPEPAQPARSPAAPPSAEASATEAAAPLPSPALPPGVAQLSPLPLNGLPSMSAVPSLIPAASVIPTASVPPLLRSVP